MNSGSTVTLILILGFLITVFAVAVYFEIKHKKQQDKDEQAIKKDDDNITEDIPEMQ